MFMALLQRWTILNANGYIADSSADNNNSAFFKFKTKITDRIGNDGIKMIKLVCH